MPAGLRPAYFNAARTVLRSPLTLAPSVVVAAAIATAMPPAMTAYSIDVAPDIASQKRLNEAFTGPAFLSPFAGGDPRQGASTTSMRRRSGAARRGAAQ